MNQPLPPLLMGKFKPTKNSHSIADGLKGPIAQLAAISIMTAQPHAVSGSTIKHRPPLPSTGQTTRAGPIATYTARDSTWTLVDSIPPLDLSGTPSDEGSPSFEL